jgi:hypothetical protein
MIYCLLINKMIVNYLGLWRINLFETECFYGICVPHTYEWIFNKTITIFTKRTSKNDRL